MDDTNSVEKSGDCQEQGDSREQDALAVGTPMPKYKCHKEVWALKIEKVVLDSDLAREDGNRETDGSATLTPIEYHFSPLKVNAEYVRKHKPVAGGYYVVYEDGYKSFSPAEAFEGGYTLIGETEETHL